MLNLNHTPIIVDLSNRWGPRVKHIIWKKRVVLPVSTLLSITAAVSIMYIYDPRKFNLEKLYSLVSGYSIIHPVTLAITLIASVALIWQIRKQYKNIQEYTFKQNQTQDEMTKEDILVTLYNKHKEDKSVEDRLIESIRLKYDNDAISEFTFNTIQCNARGIINVQDMGINKISKIGSVMNNRPIRVTAPLIGLIVTNAVVLYKLYVSHINLIQVIDLIRKRQAVDSTKLINVLDDTMLTNALNYNKLIDKVNPEQLIQILDPTKLINKQSPIQPIQLIHSMYNDKLIQALDSAKLINEISDPVLTQVLDPEKLSVALDPTTLIDAIDYSKLTGILDDGKLIQEVEQMKIVHSKRTRLIELIKQRETISSSAQGRELVLELGNQRLSKAIDHTKLVINELDLTRLKAADRTKLIKAVDPTKLIKALEDNPKLITLDSTNLVQALNPKIIKAELLKLDATKLNKVLDSTELSKVLDPTKLSKVLDSTKLSKVLDPTKLIKALEENSKLITPDLNLEMLQSELLKLDATKLSKALDSTKLMKAVDPTKLISALDLSPEMIRSELLELDSTKLSKILDSTKLSKILDSTKLNEVLDSTKLSKVLDPTKLSKVLDPTKLSKVPDPTELSKVLDSIKLSEVLDSTKLSKVLDSTKLSKILDPTKLSKVLDPTKLSKVLDPTKLINVVDPEVLSQALEHAKLIKAADAVSYLDHTNNFYFHSNTGLALFTASVVLLIFVTYMSIHYYRRTSCHSFIICKSDESNSSITNREDGVSPTSPSIEKIHPDIVDIDSTVTSAASINTSTTTDEQSSLPESITPRNNSYNAAHQDNNTSTENTRTENNKDNIKFIEEISQQTQNTFSVHYTNAKLLSFKIREVDVGYCNGPKTINCIK
jgi:hypothetical protein